MTEHLTNIWKKHKLIIILILGSLLRLLFIGNIPGNHCLFVDEMYSGYESWAMLHYGYDISGYHLPVYLTAWGSGMSVLQAYVQMPFILIFGLNSFALRLPAAILGCITLYAFYYICQNIKGEDFALFSTFILAVMPWHIMQSRWALDCNYFVGFITIAVALLIKASKDNKYLPVAFLFIGLSLYAYAFTWSVMPIFVLASLIYMYVKRVIKLDKYLVISLVILIVLAIPLLLFLLVNMDIIPEIVTPFISIPKLTIFRSDEIATSLKDIIKNFYNSLMMFISQNDGLAGDVTPAFGLYYKFSNVIIMIGLCYTIADLWKRRKESFHPEFLLLILFFCAVILASSVEIHFYRVNMIHIPMTFFLIQGLWALIQHFKGHSSEITILVYGLACVCFLSYYITYHDDTIAQLYEDGSQDAIEYINDLKENHAEYAGSDVNVLSGLTFTSVLFYDQYPTDKFISEVKYDTSDNSGVRQLVSSFGDYNFIYEGQHLDTINSGDIYVCGARDYENLDRLEALGFDLEYFTYIAVAVAR